MVKHNGVRSRKLILNLAKNDFKKKFAGSYFGVIWAFVQPVITVLLYWFVFEKALNQRASDLRTGVSVPFVLWLMGGLVPWFYFQEAMNGGTGVLIEYSYLVKKVVFQFETLPVVKLISALFTHLLSAGSVYAADYLLFVLHGDTDGRIDLCDKRDNCIFQRYEGSCFHPVTDRDVGDSDHVDI